MISVILPTFNRKASLERALASLLRQSQPRTAFELIVVDDGSTDGTAEFLDRAAATSGVRFVRQERCGPGAARNRGALIAAGAILAFIEDDVVADPRWLEEGLRAFDAPDVTAVEGVTRVEGESLRVFDAPGQLGFLPCNWFVRKEAFEAAGGYDAEFFDRSLNLYFREDADFGFKLLELGRRVIHAPGAVVTHPPQFAAAASPWRHVRRYYFDPLLARKHPRLYREQIEVKRIAGYRIRRPFHWAALASIVGWVLLAAAGNLPASIAAGALVLSGLFVMQYRYTHRWLPRVRDAAWCVAFLSLPFYYYYWLIRGCIRFRYWKTLL